MTSKPSVRASNNNSGSGKRLRLAFDHNTPQLEEQNAPLSAPSLPLMLSVEASCLSVCSTPLFVPSVPLMTSVEAALSERYHCQQERDEARAELLSNTEQLQLREQERDLAKSKAEAVARALQSEVNALLNRCNKLMEENELLQCQNNSSVNLVMECQQRISALTSRVAALEAQRDSRGKKQLVTWREALKEEQYWGLCFACQCWPSPWPRQKYLILGRLMRILWMMFQIWCHLSFWWKLHSQYLAHILHFLAWTLPDLC